MSKACNKRALWLVVGVFVVLGWGVTAPVRAATSGAPIIQPLSVGIGGEVLVGGDINPEGLETVYEIKVECRSEASLGACEPLANAPHIEGVLAAGYEGDEVRLDVTSLQPGSYGFGVLATNAAGKAFQRGQAEIHIPLPFPVTKITPYKQPEAPWIIESDQRAAERETAEYEAAKQAKEQQERAAQAAAQSEPPPLPRCIVPSLAGHTLAGARSMLAHAHCKLGHVSYPRTRHGRLHISRQSPAHGSRLPAGAKVAVRLTQ
jgi:hypothetical protein